MNILVTVGTTRFDSLIRYVDTAFRDSDYRFTLQTAGGSYPPVHFPHFTFSNDIDTYYREADLVISHAGAGSIYRLMELGRKVIVVPNLERKDQHQLDIARHMSKEGHVMMVVDFAELAGAIETCARMVPVPFEKTAFFAVDEILDCLLSQ